MVIGLCAIAGIFVPSLAVGEVETLSGSQIEAEESRSRGALLFQIHCASCHGLDARGSGPVAEHLRVAPANLCNLLERNEAGDLVLPADRLRKVISGREDVRGHGSREMPVWGLTFRDSGRAEDQGEVVAEKIDDLVEYLGTLQPSGSSEAASDAEE